MRRRIKHFQSELCKLLWFRKDRTHCGKLLPRPITDHYLRWQNTALDSDRPKPGRHLACGWRNRTDGKFGDITNTFRRVIFSFIAGCTRMITSGSKKPSMSRDPMVGVWSCEAGTGSFSSPRLRSPSRNNANAPSSFSMLLSSPTRPSPRNRSTAPWRWPSFPDFSRLFPKMFICWRWSSSPPRPSFFVSNTSSKMAKI